VNTAPDRDVSENVAGQPNVKRWPWWIALLFGAAHFSMGMLAAGTAGLMGLLLGIIMVAHRSIWPAVIAHGFLDATTFALLPRALEHLQHFR
jgi:membrane protease YdiL (CAAX protease family)